MIVLQHFIRPRFHVLKHRQLSGRTVYCLQTRISWRSSMLLTPGVQTGMGSKWSSQLTRTHKTMVVGQCYFVSTEISIIISWINNETTTIIRIIKIEICLFSRDGFICEENGRMSCIHNDLVCDTISHCSSGGDERSDRFCKSKSLWIYWIILPFTFVDARVCCSKMPFSSK